MIDRTHFSLELTAAEVAYRHRRPAPCEYRVTMRPRPWSWLHRRGGTPGTTV